MNQPAMLERIEQLHQLYCRLTGQKLNLGFDRQRLWYEFLHAGFSGEQLAQLIGYLQKEITQGRRNVGALTLCNLLQLDRFEEDLNISRVRLRPLPSPAPPSPPPSQILSAQEQEQGRQRALQLVRKLKEDI